jgi:cysteine desulfurase
MIEKMIYMDNAASTMPLESVSTCLCKIMCECYGNASATHFLGIKSREIIESARSDFLKFLGFPEGDIFFTSGATEANNLAIQGSLRGKRDGKIIATTVEHESVFNTVKHMNNLWFEIEFITPRIDGKISEKVLESVDSKTILVSIMHVNNETGTIFPIEDLGRTIKAKNPRALFHVDCTQSFGKIPIYPELFQADFITASGHKIHGPKGIGFLYVSKKTKINPIYFGGGQEAGMRPGTEATQLVAGFAEAIREIDITENYKIMSELNEYCRKKLSGIGACINSPKNASPYVLSFSLPGTKSEVTLNFLSTAGICVSAGSACSKNKESRALKGFGLSQNLVESAIRLSFSQFNTKDEIDYLIKKLAMVPK